MKVGRLWKNNSLCDELVRALREENHNGGLTANELGEILKRKPSYVGSYLWEIRKYTGAVDFKKEGYHRTPGLNEFQDNPYIQVMIAKSGSQKTWDPWVRRNFNYAKWLVEHNHFSSVSEAHRGLQEGPRPGSPLLPPGPSLELREFLQGEKEHEGDCHQGG